MFAVAGYHTVVWDAFFFFFLLWLSTVLDIKKRVTWRFKKIRKDQRVISCANIWAWWFKTNDVVEKM